MEIECVYIKMNLTNPHAVQNGKLPGRRGSITSFMFNNSTNFFAKPFLLALV